MNRMDQEYKFSRIVELMSAEELTAAEAAELDSLLDTPQLREMHDMMNDGGYVAGRLKEYAKYPYRDAFSGFRLMVRARIRRRNLRRALRAGVAVALLAVVAAAGLRLMHGWDDGEAEFAPASKHAMLITGTTGRFELSDRDTTISIGNADMIVRNGEAVFGTDGGAMDEKTQNRVVVPRAGTYTVWLPDGTKVMLNSDSELAFPAAFPADERSVTLRGEGYFEVAADASRPFIVSTDDKLDVRVLGTKFNVQAYADIRQAHVTLVEGSVGVRCGQNGVTLEPDQQVLFDREAGTLLMNPAANTSAATAWTRGYFDFEAAPLGVIIKSLEKWYDTDIVAAAGIDIDAMGLFSLRISRRGDIIPILDMLHEVTGMNYRVDGRTVLLSL